MNGKKHKESINFPTNHRAVAAKMRMARGDRPGRRPKRLRLVSPGFRSLSNSCQTYCRTQPENSFPFPPKQRMKAGRVTRVSTIMATTPKMVAQPMEASAP